MRRPSKREWVLLAVVPVLLLVAAGAGLEGKDETATVGEARPAGQTKTKNDASRAADAGELDLARLRRDVGADKPANLFSSKSWYVAPPPPPPVIVAPAPPTAPPLPFTYLGRYADSGKSVFFLVMGDRVLTVREGDIVEGNYRVDGVVGSALDLTYLPLKIKQTLDMGDAG